MENNTTSGKSHAKTIQFELQLNWLEKQRAIATSNDVSDTLRVALPYSFGGSGREWSPEHLFIASISSCFMTTFLVLLEKNKLSISNYECQAKGQVEKVDG
ncbi:MAG TPA: OsmC family protein, partial [Puia sp.]|nr:OsmC family protein [Puia sp.]